MYIFIGVAVIVGALTGASLHYISGFLLSVFKLDERTFGPIDEIPLGGGSKIGGHESDIPGTPSFPDDVASLGAVSDTNSSQISWDWIHREQDRGRNGMIPNTIIEEDDSSDV